MSMIYPVGYLIMLILIFTIDIFNHFNAIYVSILKFNIILNNENNFHHYFRLSIVIFVVFNPNCINNKKSLYFTSSLSINYILVFFRLVFKVYFDGFLKELVIL